MQSRFARVMLLFIVVTLSACASNASKNVASTAFPYSILSNDVGQEKYPRVLIAHVNFGKPSRKYMRPYESRVDEFVRQYLKDSGFKMVSSAVFEDEWTNAVRRYGNPFNPTTGKINQTSFGKTMNYVFEQLRSRGIVDAVVFTDLIEREISYGNSVNRVARWDGVSRKVSTQGPGSGVPSDFNWAQSAEAVSIWLNVFDMNLQAVFQSAGGIEVTQALSLKSTPKFVRRRNLLGNRRHIEEGVSLAFHPMIEMKGYPGVEREPVGTAIE